MSGESFDKSGGSAFPEKPIGMDCTTAGLTKREWLIGKVLSNPAICHSELMTWQAARAAIDVADTVLEMLNKETEAAQ